MSNSALVSYTKISPNSTNPRNHKIDKITIHHMAGNLSVETCEITNDNLLKVIPYGGCHHVKKLEQNDKSHENDEVSLEIGLASRQLQSFKLLFLS